MEVNDLPKTFIILLFILFQEITFAQLGINAIGVPPASNAMLNIISTTKGLLIPRMTTTQRAALTQTQGLTVFDIATNRYGIQMVQFGLIWLSYQVPIRGLRLAMILAIATLEILVSTMVPVHKLDAKEYLQLIL